MSTVFACKVDRSPDTGSLVVCTCGFAIGPYLDHPRAVRAAEQHRAIHTPTRPRRKSATT